jgi:hypothetical protein
MRATPARARAAKEAAGQFAPHVHGTITYEVDADTAAKLHAKDINTYSIGDGSYTLEEPARNIPIPRDETRSCAQAPWCAAAHHHPDCPIAGVK